jgi:hypothetical protein
MGKRVSPAKQAHAASILAQEGVIFNENPRRMQLDLPRVNVFTNQPINQLTNQRYLLVLTISFVL